MRSRRQATAGILSASVILAIPARAQSGFVPLDSVHPSSGPLAALVTLDVTRRALGDGTGEIAQQANISFVADRSLAGMEREVAWRVARVTARNVFRHALANVPLRANGAPMNQMVIVPRPAKERPGSPLRLLERVRVSGYVRNKASKEVVRHALVSADAGAVRGESNEEGFYFLNLAPGSHALRAQAIGFTPLDTTVTISGNTALDLYLAPRIVRLEELAVRVTADRPDLDPAIPDMGTIRLDLKTAHMAPAVLGEHDVIRTLMLLPGVSTTSDASTGFNVRGGTVDQNLILLDEATLYNPSHILGFLSVFNSDAIDDITLYKGFIPARFGGRLSSVLDIRQREGNAARFAGDASIGLLSSRALLEGPLLPNQRGSFMVAARRSFADLFLKASSDSSVRNTVAYFYDVNAKGTVRVGATGALIASGYLGRDRFAGLDALGVGWGNKSGTLRWNQVFGGNVFSKITATASAYDYRIAFPFEVKETATWVAGIKSAAGKVDETIHLTDRNAIELGGEISRDQFDPGAVRVTGDSTPRRATERRRSIAAATYVGQEVELSSRVSIRYGLRVSAFRRVGKATIARYVNDSPLVFNQRLGRYEPGTVVDSVEYGSGATVSTFGGIEPRATLRVALNETSSLKASYARTRQYLQLVSRTNSPTPLDVWEPAGPFIKPQVADQVALGYSATVGAYELSAETYVRRSYNILDFVDGADVVLQDRLETALLQGEGRGYGLELFARRRSGAFTGWISYTLSRAEQRFPAPVTVNGVGEGGINRGRYYPSPSDRTHNLSVVLVHPVGKRWTLGSALVGQTGLPITLPLSRYTIDGLLVSEYGDRNAQRLPPYLRLDLSATRRGGRGELQLGVFNVLNRFNAQSIFFRQKEGEPLLAEAVERSIFGAVPSVSYTFRF